MSDPIAPLIDALHSQGRLRVWSLVITAFGDLVQHRGGEISTARLGQLLGRVGVEQGALRTALSRLGRDGWVTSERQGRTSIYRLSAQGLERFAPATTLIYAPPRIHPVTQWAMSVTLDASGSQSVTLRPADEGATPADARVIGQATQLSKAFRASQLSAPHSATLAALRDDLRVLDDLEITPDTPLLDVAAARLLLIHRWRRIVLRFPDIAPELMPETAPLANPRLAVAQTYVRLARFAETWMDTPDVELLASPEVDAGFARRFANTQQT